MYFGNARRFRGRDIYGDAAKHVRVGGNTDGPATAIPFSLDDHGVSRRCGPDRCVGSGSDLDIRVEVSAPRAYYCGSAVILVAFSFAQIIRPALYIPRDDFDESAAQLKTGDSYDCWLPVWATAKALLEKRRVAADSREIEIGRWDDLEKTIHIAAGPEETARFALFYYPNWQVTINGARVDAAPAEDGALTVELPAEKVEVEVRFVDVSEKYFRIFSGVIFAILVAGVFATTHRRRPE